MGYIFLHGIKEPFFRSASRKNYYYYSFQWRSQFFSTLLRKTRIIDVLDLKSLPLVNIGLSTNLRLGDISNFLSEAINKQKMYTPGNRPKIVWGPLPFPIFGILNIRDSHRTWRPPLKPKILNYPPVTLYRIKLVILKNSY